jgi:hypothetical protein
VVPTLAERASKPLVSSRTLRGSDLSSLRLGPLRGSSLLGKGPGHSIPTVTATVMCCGRAFSGTTAARVVGGRDGPPRLFGCHAIMIAQGIEE